MTEKYKTSNPALNEDVFSDAARSRVGQDVMTLDGAANKTGILLAICICSAAMSWVTGLGIGVCLVSALVAFVVALVLIFNPPLSVFLAPVYAILEGFAVGGISRIYEQQYPGIAMNAFILTVGILGVMLFLYRAHIIEATENFKLAVVSATGGIAILYIIDIVLMMFGMPISFIHQGGFWGIAFSLFVVGLAALNLVMDFDFIESGVEARAPKYMEWYGAFGLLVTLVWLYFEILRLLSKLKK